MRIENFRVAFDASRASLVSKIMKRRISVGLAIQWRVLNCFGARTASDDAHDRRRRMRSADVSSIDIHPHEGAVRSSADRRRVITLDEQDRSAQTRFMKVLALLLCASLVGMSAARHVKAEAETADVARYGPYPTNYKEIVTKWLETQLVDAGSARIEWNGNPKPADLGTNGEHLYGYVVYFKVNARNRFGTYTGMQNHGALIRNGKVIKGLGLGY